MYVSLAVIALGMSLFSSNVQALTWEELFKQKEALFEQYPKLAIIKRQHAAYKNGTAPAIAHPDIKSIPILECGEVLVDVRDKEQDFSRISMMPNPTMPFESDECNSGLPSASKMRAGVYSKLVNMVTWLDTLSGDYNYERNQTTIKVFEGLRDLKTQAMLFNNKKAAIMAANPEMSEDQADAETSKWVSPVKNNVPVHSTGAAVDLRLWDQKKGKYLDAGKFGVIWGANPSAPTFSEDITDEQKNNRLYFLMAAVQADFTNYQLEHWHVGSGDKADEFWHQDDPTQRAACYGSIE
jgi:D-alanyl-D-alanine dipeptidase